MLRTGDHALVKELNRSIVLRVLRRHSPISRTDVSKSTGLNKATVSVIMDELIAQGLVTEVGPAPTTVGRRPVLCRFNPSAGVVIGLQINLDGVYGVLTDLSGHVLNQQTVPSAEMSNPAVACAVAVQLVRSLSELTPKTRLGLLGFGVGVPGLVDFSDGRVFRAPNLAWSDVPLRTMLQAHVNIPVWIDNEANTGALAEWLFGQGIGLSNLVYLSFGHGVGTGVIVDGQLVRGVHGLAGEFGHMTIVAGGRRCSCDGQGCLEMYASEKAIVAAFAERTGQRVPVSAIVQRAIQGDQEAEDCIHEAGVFLGIGLSNIANALDTSHIVIGHELRGAEATFLGAVTQTFEQYCFSHTLSSTGITLSTLTVSPCALGAAALVLQEHFRVPSVRASAT